MHWSIWGPTGSGKGNLINTWVRDWFKKGHWVTYVAPHADIAEKLIAELYYELGPAMFRRPILIERLSDTDRVIMREYIRRSTKTGFEGMQENEQFASPFIETLAQQRRKIDLAESPALNDLSLLLAAVYQSQDHWCPEWWLRHGVECRHACHSHLVRHCLLDHLRTELEAIRFYPHQDKIRLLYAVTRLFKAVYGKAPIMARTSKPATTDWIAFKNAGGLHFLLAGDAAPEADRLHVRSDFQRTVFDGHLLTREGFYVFDEVNNRSYWAPFEFLCLATVRHLGISMVGQFQSANFAEQEDFRAVLSNTNHVWMPQQDFDMAKIATLDCSGLLSRDKISHVDEIKRQVNKGFREVTHVLKGKTHGEHGHSKSEREQLSMLPVYETEIEKKPIREQHDSQVFWQAQQFMEMQIGEAVVREMRKKPYKIHVPLMKDSWPFGMAQKKVEQCIERIKQRPEYETPEIRYPEPPTTPLGKRGTKKPGRG